MRFEHKTVKFYIPLKTPAKINHNSKIEKNPSKTIHLLFYSESTKRFFDHESTAHVEPIDER